jgi:hypothetical protein
MTTWTPFGLIDAAASPIARAVVLAVADGRVEVACEELGPAELTCDLMHTSDAHPLALTVGDAVIVWRPPSPEGYGVVLGRVGVSKAAPPPVGTSDEVVLEARKQLTLRVGEGSITVREDGKILIKGKDIVSHAKRVNRIRGGSVAIN